MTPEETRIIEAETLSIRAHPPSRDVYVTGIEGGVWIAHYCLDLQHGHGPRWKWSATGLHTLVSRHPLHLEPSIGWMECCGRHGFIRGGAWEPCGDDRGWQA